MSIRDVATEVITDDFGQELVDDMAAFEYAGVPVLIQINEDAKSITVYAKMGRLPEEDPGSVALELLGMNLSLVYGFGQHLACDLENREVLLVMAIAEAEATRFYVSEALRTFAVTAKFQQERLTSMLVSEVRPPEQSESGEEPSQPSPFGMRA